MPDATPPSCFTSRTIAVPPPSTANGPTLTTSIYETHLGLAALTWSRTVLGLSLRVDLRIPSLSSSSPASFHSTLSSSSSTVNTSFPSVQFRLRPWLLWKRKGTKRFCPKQNDHHGSRPFRTVDFAWDLTRASFPSTGGPEPSSDFVLAVAIDGEMFLIVGDSEKHDHVYRRTKAKKLISVNPRKGSPGNPVLVSRREFADLPESGGRRVYMTRANIGSGENEKERVISIDLLGHGDADLCIRIDGEIVLNVRRLKWKFRGNERIEIDGGAGVQVSWDVHNWLFSQPATGQQGGGGRESEFGQAIFVFRFDGNLEEGSGGKSGRGPYDLGCFGNIADCDRGGGQGSKRRSKKKVLMKMRSLSVSSSASSGSNSSVRDWASVEENELKESDGFSLLLYFSMR